METLQPETLPTPCRSGRRMSIFTEVGLIDEETIQQERSPIPSHGQSLKKLRPAQMLRFRSLNDVINRENDDGEHESDWESIYDEEEDASIPLSPKPVVPGQYAISPKFYRLALFSVALALLLPLLQLNPLTRVGVRGGHIPRATIQAQSEHEILSKRDNSPVDVCKRFSGQSTIVNGTLYMYGFRTLTDSQQTSGTWSKFLIIHLYVLLSKFR